MIGMGKTMRGYGYIGAKINANLIWFLKVQGVSRFQCISLLVLQAMQILSLRFKPTRKTFLIQNWGTYYLRNHNAKLFVPSGHDYTSIIATPLSQHRSGLNIDAHTHTIIKNKLLKLPSFCIYYNRQHAKFEENIKFKFLRPLR